MNAWHWNSKQVAHWLLRISKTPNTYTQLRIGNAFTFRELLPEDYSKAEPKQYHAVLLAPWEVAICAHCRKLHKPAALCLQPFSISCTTCEPLIKTLFDYEKRVGAATYLSWVFYFTYNIQVRDKFREILYEEYKRQPQ